MAVDRDKDPEQEKKQRTLRQNRAFWLFCQMLAEQLNEAGLDQRKVLKPGIDIPWTKDAIHDQMWIPIQKIMYGTSSTTELKTGDIDKIVDVLCRHLGSEFSIELSFPSIETMLHDKQAKEMK